LRVDCSNETHCRNPSQRSAPTSLNQSLGILLLQMPSNSSHKATATPSSLTSGANLCLLRIVHCYQTSSSLPSSRPIPLHIHTHFDRLMALMPSPAGPRPRIHPLHSHRSDICALLHHADGRIPASFQHADGLANEAQLGMCVLVRRRMRISRANLVHLVHLSTAVDGEGEVRGWGSDDDLDEDRKTSKEWEYRRRRSRRLDGDGGQVRVRIHPSPTLSLTLRFGVAVHTVEAVTYCHPLSHRPPSASLLLSPPSPSPCSLIPTLAFPSLPLCGTGRAGFELQRYPYVLAHSQRWRSAGVGTGAARAHPPLPIVLPPHTHLSSLDAYAYARVVEAERWVRARACTHAYGAYPTLVLALALVIEQSAAGVVVFLLRGCGGRALCGSGYTFGFG
ncbi:hypothetical protein B0H13DRAFT_2458441, partial [Mycena leptocephala]